MIIEFTFNINVLYMNIHDMKIDGFLKSEALLFQNIFV